MPRAHTEFQQYDREILDGPNCNANRENFNAAETNIIRLERVDLLLFVEGFESLEIMGGRRDTFRIVFYFAHQ